MDEKCFILSIVAHSVCIEVRTSSFSFMFSFKNIRITVDKKLIAGKMFKPACYRKVPFRSEFVTISIDPAVSLVSVCIVPPITYYSCIQNYI